MGWGLVRFGLFMVSGFGSECSLSVRELLVDLGVVGL